MSRRASLGVDGAVLVDGWGMSGSSLGVLVDGAGVGGGDTYFINMLSFV